MKSQCLWKFIKFVLISEVNPHAEVAKLVDVLALGASGVTHGGSSPLLGTANEMSLARKRVPKCTLVRTRSPIEHFLKFPNEQKIQSGY